MNDSSLAMLALTGLLWYINKVCVNLGRASAVNVVYGYIYRYGGS